MSSANNLLTGVALAPSSGGETANRVPVDRVLTDASHAHLLADGGQTPWSRYRIVPKRVPAQAFDVAATALELCALIASASAATIMFADPIDLAAAPAFVRATTISLLFYVLASHGLGGHGPTDRFAYREAAIRSAVTWALVMLFLCLMGWVLHAAPLVPEQWTALFAIFGILTLPIVRIASVAGARAVRRAGVFNVRTAIVGTPQQAQLLAGYIGAHPWLTVSVGRLYDDLAGDTEGDRDAKVAGNGLAELTAAIRAGLIDQVLITLPPTATDRLSFLVEQLRLMPVRIRWIFDGDLPLDGRSPVALLGNLPFMTLEDRPQLGWSGAIKGLADRVVGLALLVAFLPLFGCVALCLRLDTAGPTFFFQDREGYNCRPFRIWKFRSMHVKACAETTVVQARGQDPRVTRVGRFLRRSSIDELPQLINVVLGEMSLVGPRPHAVSTRAGGVRFGDITATYPARHRIKPGITGWAQVNGLRGETDTQEKLLKRLDHDLYYCRNWSLGFDLHILLRTVFVVPFQRDVY